MPSPQPSPTGEGANTKTVTPGLPFCFYLATRLFVSAIPEPCNTVVNYSRENVM
ncbi:hypothetical protein HMPREF0484_2742 [Klebsiella pneumoniae subsp. rhinoscleromatis ATCC 13884]|nr:hypothetical protein HMPREF0484_2742 [Klebsiella pneumoniae subsp. rhinoscleromatis ATCC 13884]